MKLKYAVLAMPRTAGTKLQFLLQLGLRVNLQIPMIYYGEFNNQNSSSYYINDLLLCQDWQDIVVKITPVWENLDLIRAIQWENFDCIYFTRRRNLADQLISLVAAKKTNQYIRSEGQPWIENQDSFEINQTDIDNFIKSMSTRNSIESYIKSKNDRIVTFDFDSLSQIEPSVTVGNIKFKLGPIPTNNNYKLICSNYDWVENALSDIKNG